MTRALARPAQALRLLALRPGAMGDLLLALPALHAIAGANPQARIEVAANHAFTPLLTLCPVVNGLHDFGSALFSDLFVTGQPPGRTLARLLADFDSAVLWMRDPGDQVARRLRECGVACIAGGGTALEVGSDQHMAMRLARMAGQLAPGEPDTRRATLDARALGLSAPGSGTRLLLHPGSGGRQKLWGVSRFAQLARELYRAGLEPAVLEGPADEVPVRELASTLGAPVVRCESMLDLARAVAGSALFAGNDSGPAHLAAALGVPTIAIFGPTDPAVWAPCGPRVATLGGRGSWPEPDVVVEGSLALLTAAPSPGAAYRESR